MSQVYNMSGMFIQAAETTKTALHLFIKGFSHFFSRVPVYIYPQSVIKTHRQYF